MNAITPTPAGQPVIVENVLYHANAIIATWMHDKMGETGLVETGFVAMGIVDPAVTSVNISDKLVCGVYFFNHKDVNDWKDIEVCIAMKPEAFIHPKSITQILRYPFQDLKLPRVTAVVDMGNVKALVGVQQLGFVYEGRKRMGGANRGDLGVFGLLPEECKFWKGEL